VIDIKRVLHLKRKDFGEIKPNRLEIFLFLFHVVLFNIIYINIFQIVLDSVQLE